MTEPFQSGFESISPNVPKVKAFFKLFLLFLAIFQKKTGARCAPVKSADILFLDQLENVHGTLANALAAGDALGDLVANLNHDLEGTCSYALAAADAELLIDHVNALGVLGDSVLLASLSALAALRASLNHDAAVLLVADADAGLILVKLLVESGGAGDHALETGIALGMISYLYLLHYGETSVVINIMSAAADYFLFRIIT